VARLDRGYRRPRGQQFCAFYVGGRAVVGLDAWVLEYLCCAHRARYAGPSKVSGTSRRPSSVPIAASSPREARVEVGASLLDHRSLRHGHHLRGTGRRSPERPPSVDRLSWQRANHHAPGVRRRREVWDTPEARLSEPRNPDSWGFQEESLYYFLSSFAISSKRAS
jgi:hypothetical protein